VGSGFRTFTAGEVLTASNVQNYLMDQSVMVFGGSAARSSAIGTANFEEGMVSYLTDTDKVEAYNGTDWVSVAPTTSQGLTLINTTSFSGVSSVSLPADTFTATYDNYKILFSLTAFGTSGTITGRLRAAGSDNTANYSNGTYEVRTNNTSAIYAANVSQSSFTFNICSSVSGQTTGSYSFDLITPKPAVVTKLMGFSTGHTTDDSAAKYLYLMGLHTSTNSFDSFSFIFPGSSSGNVSAYGYSK
jgi:hypothetical protein